MAWLYHIISEMIKIIKGSEIPATVKADQDHLRNTIY